jgi:hypothetical protein
MRFGYLACRAVCLLLPVAASAAAAGEMPALSVRGSAEIRSAYLSRGKVVDAAPFPAQFADCGLSFGRFGTLGASVWSASSFSGRGQSVSKRYAYNEADYNLHYCYGVELADDWTLSSCLAMQWVTFPGYRRPDLGSRCEWHVSQRLENPWLTPYYLLRRAYEPMQWCYWRVGLERRFAIADRFAFIVDGFGEIGDGGLFFSQYGASVGRDEASCHGGLNALNIVFGVEYALTENTKVYGSVRQFGLVSADARRDVKASSAAQSRRDLTVATIGVEVRF